MKSNQTLLLRTLLRSSSELNVIRYEKNKKKRSAAIGEIVGKVALYVILLGLCIAIAIGYGSFGLTDAIPSLTVMTIVLLSFILTLLKTNGYLFAFKDYDMTMALPFRVRTVVASRFLYMYIKTLPWNATISVAMLVSYIVFDNASPLTIVSWLVLTLLIPLIPMVVAAALGALAAGIGAGFKHKQIIQTVFILIFVLLCFASRFLIEDMVKNDKIEATLMNISSISDSICGVYFPAKWFARAVTEGNLLYLLLFGAVSVALFELFILVVTGFYRQINSKLMTGAAHKNYKMQHQKSKSIERSVAFKEFKQMISSTNYLVNMGLGEIFVIILCVALIFVDVESILSVITSNAPVTKEMILPSVPLIVYFLVGMVSTTTCSYSLEGKNYWILKSLPVPMGRFIRGKMLFNLYIEVPFTVLGNVCLGIACKASLVQILLFNICGIACCLFSTAFGMRCNIKHPKLEWTNDIEVIKQGSSVVVYLFPNMLVTMLLLVGAVLGAFVFGTELTIIVVTVIYLFLALLCYKSTMKLTEKL